MSLVRIRGIEKRIRTLEQQVEKEIARSGIEELVKELKQSTEELAEKVRTLEQHFTVLEKAVANIKTAKVEPTLEPAKKPKKKRKRRKSKNVKEI